LPTLLMPFGRVSEVYLARDVGGNAEHALGGFTA
jgi:hypothetical protein